MSYDQIDNELSENDFKRLSQFIYDNYGINLYPRKKVLLVSRLKKRLNKIGIKTYTEYCDYIINKDKDHKEALQMVDHLSTNKTDFFREPDQFEFLTEKLLLPYIDETGRRKIKLWSAGCSSGEEPYSIAMALSELKTGNSSFDFEIFASDISTTVLEKASKAIYTASAVDNIPIQYRNKYLLKSKNKAKKQIRINSVIRNKIELFRYNLLSDSSPFDEPLDIIFCRNTLIYFDRPTQEKVVNKLLDELKNGGYLFLGHSESLINMDFPVKLVSSSVYLKI